MLNVIFEGTEPLSIRCSAVPRSVQHSNFLPEFGKNAECATTAQARRGAAPCGASRCHTDATTQRGSRHAPAHNVNRSIAQDVVGKRERPPFSVDAYRRTRCCHTARGVDAQRSEASTRGVAMPHGYRRSHAQCKMSPCNAGRRYIERGTWSTAQTAAQHERSPLHNARSPSPWHPRPPRRAARHNITCRTFRRQLWAIPSPAALSSPREQRADRSAYRYT